MIFRKPHLLEDFFLEELSYLELIFILDSNQERRPLTIIKLHFVYLATFYFGKTSKGKMKLLKQIILIPDNFQTYLNINS